MFESIDAAYFLAFGILLIGLEALTFSFILFFIGIGFLFVALLSYFISFDSAIEQVALGFVTALIMAFLFRKYLLQKISKPTEKNEERAHVSGVGHVEENMIKFDGTYWKTLDDMSVYKDGDKVEIIDVVDNMVILKK